MPLYEYKCKKCGQVTEKIRKFSDPPLTICESCGGEIEQLISSPAIQFKGTGWYVTDYAHKSSVPGNDHESSQPAEKKAPEKKEVVSSKASEPAHVSPSAN